MHVDRSSGWHVNTSEVNKVRVLLLLIMGWVFRHCKGLDKSEGQYLRGVELVKQGWRVVCVD